MYTQCVHTCQMFTTSGRVQLYTVRQYHMSVRCMATADIRISTSSSGFSTRIFLRTQICRILKNFFDFSKVPDSFSTSWNSELHSRRKSYTIIATVPSIYRSRAACAGMHARFAAVGCMGFLARFRARKQRRAAKLINYFSGVCCTTT
jgi:hypothetical protein